MKKPLGLLLLFLYGFITLASSGFVYCQDSDGHVAIELIHEKAHCAQSHENHDDHHFPLDHEIPCEPCEDTPVEMEDQLPRRTNDQLFDVDTFVLENFVIYFYPTSLALSCFSKPPPQYNTTLALLRTVILLV